MLYQVARNAGRMRGAFELSKSQAKGGLPFTGKRRCKVGKIQRVSSETGSRVWCLCFKEDQNVLGSRERMSERGKTRIMVGANRERWGQAKIQVW